MTPKKFLEVLSVDYFCAFPSTSILNHPILVVFYVFITVQSVSPSWEEIWQRKHWWLFQRLMKTYYNTSFLKYIHISVRNWMESNYKGDVPNNDLTLSIKTSSNRNGLHLLSHLPKRSHGQSQLSLAIPETFLSLHNLGTRPYWRKHKWIIIANIKVLSCCQLESLPLLTRICNYKC